MVDEGEEEEVEENDLDCEGELGDMDVESPPWNFYGDDDIDCDDEIDDQEDTALLRASAAKTEIVITPMSPVSVTLWFFFFFFAFASIILSESTQSTETIARNTCLFCSCRSGNML